MARLYKDFIWYIRCAHRLYIFYFFTNLLTSVAFCVVMRMT